MPVQAKTDSLMALLKTTRKEKDRLELYKNICWHFINSQPQLELATDYADTVRMLSAKLSDKKGRITAVYFYGIIAEKKGNYEEAQKLLKNYTEYHQNLGDSVQISKGLFHLGIVNAYLGNYDKSLSMFYRILSIEEKLNNRKNVAHALVNVGAIYRSTKKFKEAIGVYEQAGKIYKTLGAKTDYAQCLQNLANIYSDPAAQDYAKAGILYQESLRIFEDFGNQSLVAIVLGNLGNLQRKMGKYKQALPYHQRALAIWRKSLERYNLAFCLNNIGKCYLKLKKYDQADKYFEESMQLSIDSKSNALLYDVYANINQLHAEQKNFEKAYHFYVLSNQVKDSIYNEKNAKQINELQAKYETATKDKQIVLLAKEKEMQRQEARRQATLKKASVGGLALVTLLAGLVFYVFRQRLKNQKVLTAKDSEIKEVNFKRQLSELEMKALRAQINPHFLFNCMNSINRMVLGGETENASLYLTKFSKLVRLILENAEAATVSLENELALLKSYIQLEELRFKGKISYHISVDEAIEPESTYLPSMVLQPFVENAIWHGLMHKQGEEKGLITINVSEENDRLLCTIEDNGVGREKARQLREKSVWESKSMGIKITEERLRLLSREGREQLIRITDLKDILNHALGTRVDILIPLA